MSIWDKAKKMVGAKEKAEPEITPEILQKVLSIYGLSKIDDTHIALTADGKEDLFKNIFPDTWKDDSGFVDFWKRYAYNIEQNNENGRSSRYKNYEFMRNDSPEIELFIDTLVSEILSYQQDDTRLINFNVLNDKIIDKPLTDYVNNRIADFEFDNKQIIETMVVYGNMFLKCNIDKNKLTIRDEFKDMLAIQIFNFPYAKQIRNYILDSKFDLRLKENKQLMIYEVVNFCIQTSDKNFLPYGKSLLESCRSPYKKLTILESFLALSRSSKVDKLVVSFPSGQSTPEGMLTKAIHLRAMLKDVIFGSGSNVKTSSKPFAFTDIILAPKGKDGEGFTFDRLTRGMDFTSIEDIEYFWNKMIAGTRMPRSMFKPDENYQGYRKLALQDMRFARLLSMVLYSYAKSFMPFVKLMLLVEKNIDVSKIQVTADFNQITALSGEQSQVISSGLDILNNMVTMMRDNLGFKEIPINAFKKLFMTSTGINAKDTDELFSKIKTIKFSSPDAMQPNESEGNFTPPDGYEESITFNKVGLILEELNELNDKQKIVSEKVVIMENKTASEFLITEYQKNNKR